MYEEIRGRGARTQLYLVQDIVNTLNSVATLTGPNETLDALAVAFGLRRKPVYEWVLEEPVRPALLEARR